MVKARSLTGWRSLILWSIAFGTITFTVISAASIGLFVAPFALLITIIVVVWSRFRSEALPGGLLIGPGVIFLLVAFLNRGYVPCSAEPVSLTAGQNFSCGGLDPTPWLITGQILVAAGLASYFLLKSARSKYRMTPKGE